MSEQRTIPQTVVRFMIFGTPAPGGSKTTALVRDAAGNPIMLPTKNGKRRPMTRTYDDAKGNAKWKRVVRDAAVASKLFPQPLTGPLRVSFTFFLERPKAHHEAGDRSRPVRAKYSDAIPVVRPDALKLARSTEDALTGIAWRDDSQAFHVSSLKQYVRGDEWTGCLVEIGGPL